MVVDRPRGTDGRRDAEARLLIAAGDPRPGSRNDCIVYRDSGIAETLADQAVMADGGYQGNSDVVMPYRKPHDSSDLPEWKKELNATHRKVRVRIDPVLSPVKNFKILRDYRRVANTLTDNTVSGTAYLHNPPHRLTATQPPPIPTPVTRHPLDQGIAAALERRAHTERLIRWRRRSVFVEGLRVDGVIGVRERVDDHPAEWPVLIEQGRAAGRDALGLVAASRSQTQPACLHRQA